MPRSPKPQMPNLLPCPFCGDKALSEIPYYTSNPIVIFCGNCGASIERIYANPFSQRALNSAVKAWNRRVYRI